VISDHGNGVLGSGPLRRLIRAACVRGWWVVAPLAGVEERTPATPTNTQFLLQLSGYRWATEVLGPVHGLRVLDVASGEGFGVRELGARRARVVGVDLDPRALARTARVDGSARLACMDAAGLAFRDDAFDLVISQDTLEHVEDDVGFVRQACRVLRRGGTLLLFTPHAPVHTTSPSNPYHLREYSATSLRALLTPYFDSIRLFGRRPGAAMRRAEAGLDTVRRWDPLGLRRLVAPPALRHRLASWLLRVRGMTPLEALSADGVEYFEGVDGSLTLIALCRKGAGG